MVSNTMDGNLLKEVSEEKDLGIIIDKKLKFHSHTALVVNKANRMLGLVRHCFVNLSFTTYISTHSPNPRIYQHYLGSLLYYRHY